MLARFKPLAMTPVTAWRLVRIALLVGFVFLAGRFWHPYYGFTYFLQMDQRMGAATVPVLRDGPLYLHHERGSYDGAYYVQVATSPGLRDPALATTLDDAGYRARRILLGAVAWCLGGGEPVLVAHCYAALNVVLWFGLAALLWRVFPAADWRAVLAWAGLLFGAGVLSTVRCALTDLAALLLLAGAVVLAERGRTGWSAGLLGLAGLARETSVLGAVALLPGTRVQPGLSWKTTGWLALAVTPILFWVIYVRQVFGASGAGLRNFNWWPLAGWFGHWRELTAADTLANDPWLIVRCGFEHIALLVQAAYLLSQPKKDCPWWRTGLVYVALMFCLGGAVWEGLPNAATRVLLPLTLAFNVRAVRNRAFFLWLLLGNLSVLTGVQALWFGPARPHDLPAQSTWAHRQALISDDRWYVADENWKRRWAWCGQDGGLTVLVWPKVAQVQLQLEVRGVTARDMQVSNQGRVVWRGPIGTQREWITLPPLPADQGKVVLELHTDSPTVTTGEGVMARELGLSCSGVRSLKE